MNLESCGLSVECVEEVARENIHVIIRTFSISSTSSPTAPSSSHVVKHFQFTAWRDHSVPEDTASFLQLHKLFVECWRATSPAIIHCRWIVDWKLIISFSAGCGRTGVFLAVDIFVDLMTRRVVADSSAALLLGIIQEMRNQRPHMVQTRVLSRSFTLTAILESGPICICTRYHHGTFSFVEFVILLVHCILTPSASTSIKHSNRSCHVFFLYWAHLWYQHDEALSPNLLSHEHEIRDGVVIKWWVDDMENVKSHWLFYKSTHNRLESFRCFNRS